MIGKIYELSKNEIDFPKIINLNEGFVNMGSYARKTQVSPLDDIDIMIVFSAEGSCANFNTNHWDNIDVFPSENAEVLKKLENDKGTLSSIKIINKIKDKISNIYQYSKSEISRDHQALRLELSSYDWGFDIVPGFITKEDDEGNYFYLIPNGNGSWIKTNPKIDRENIYEYQKKVKINIKEIIRILKYWRTRHQIIQSIDSYALETSVLDFVDSNEDSRYLDNERKFIEIYLEYLTGAIMRNINDRKNIQGNINNIDYKNIHDFYAITSKYHDIVRTANIYENNGLENSSINQWESFFGE